MNRTEKNISAALAIWVFLQYGGQAERNHVQEEPKYIPNLICSEPLPEITDRDFGTELYRKAVNCKRGLLERLDPPNNIEEFEFKYNGVEHHLIISEDGSITIRFRQRHYTSEGSEEHIRLRGYVADVTPKFVRENPNLGFTLLREYSSDRPDSICEIVSVTNEYLGKTFHSIFGMEHTKEEREPAQRICRNILNGLRNSYNENSRRHSTNPPRQSLPKENIIL